VRGRPVPPGEGIAPLAGWVPDGDGVFLSDTVGDNVARPPGTPPAEPGAARDALELVGLAGRAGEPVAGLGRGGRRRVALARALAGRRPLLVVDGELDPTIWALLPGLLAQTPWVEGTLLATATLAAMAGLGGTLAIADPGGGPAGPAGPCGTPGAAGAAGAPAATGPGPGRVALVADERVVAQGHLADLAASTDPDVRAVLVWVGGSV
jgi:hypothetical protein